ncbi:beta-ketoacyl synthase N-terminal-like domain-containing protein [Streptomyces sp. TRM 70351]|uniref:beta-ketoacyl synthase N-terminal-like domain-containing protein n=1 Tax=Streptomyces sp. TRM 70351 TaxID=3116552 RepID=UPI002E7C3810|nr:beta-ketoacyl synthase N-terminal-like domain-containing protein [Streptomyces sp. TRM 70351]MEE1928887.1 beta-ketoacyl synthase N-terminal-like domain-containing protein [Streptomyces sp. TRM 70351]
MTAPAPPRPLVAVVGAGLAVPGASSPEQLWNRTRRGDPVFAEPARFDLADFYSDDPQAQDRTYGRAFGELTGFRPHPRLEPRWADPAPPDRQAAWLRHSALQALDGVRVAEGVRSGAFVAASTEASHELDAAVAADFVAAGTARHLPGDPVRTATRLRERLADGGQRAARSHESVLPHPLVSRALGGVVPADTPLIVVDNICPAGLYAIDLGVRHLLDDETDLALCGGDEFARAAAPGVLRQDGRSVAVR